MLQLASKRDIWVCAMTECRLFRAADTKSRIIIVCWAVEWMALVMSVHTFNVTIQLKTNEIENWRIVVVVSPAIHAPRDLKSNSKFTVFREFTLSLPKPLLPSIQQSKTESRNIETKETKEIKKTEKLKTALKIVLAAHKCGVATKQSSWSPTPKRNGNGVHVST